MSNHLAGETSPYLLQHAGNPVDWYPWGDEALSRAKSEDKPILLSIGYSACHWCHVMAHETFENVNLASFMNESFINIKVDREERPDLDSVYMQAVQAITGSGGWPLTVFLTPDVKPFFGGTYFPPEDRHGMAGFDRILKAVADAYRDRRGGIEKAAKQIIAVLTSEAGGDEGEPLTADILKEAYLALQGGFDKNNGGFGLAPKFPQPVVLEFLLSYFHRTQDKAVLETVVFTLEKMARGGIYDQLGGGFHRYATDSSWFVPHFEKMLYDNALLSRVYLHAYLATDKQLFRAVAEETIDYVIREMTHPQGAFYSTQDADSDGMEGKYYLWTLPEIIEVMGKDKGQIVADYFGVTAGGNFEGQNILHVIKEPEPEMSTIISQARASLLKKREQRVKPGRDEKVLASWNGLMLATLAEAAYALGRRDYLAAAIANGSFLLDTMVEDGFLRHTYKDDRVKFEGYLDDYAMVIEGLMNLHQATFRGEWLRQAISLARIMIEQFWDGVIGVFYDTGGRHENLFIRPKATLDSALPSGASMAVLVLLKLSWLTDNREFKQIAVQALKSVRGVISRYPLGYGSWLCALEFYLSEPKQIVIIGSMDNPVTLELLKTVCTTWLPNKVVLAYDPGDPAPVSRLKLLENRGMFNNQPTAYVCHRYSCQRPVTDPVSLAEQLRE
ncbi:thioredoxin domain-containing protein [Chloroflexota bacterium]